MINSGARILAQQQSRALPIDGGSSLARSAAQPPARLTLVPSISIPSVPTSEPPTASTPPTPPVSPEQLPKHDVQATSPTVQQQPVGRQAVSVVPTVQALSSMSHAAVSPVPAQTVIHTGSSSSWWQRPWGVVVLFLLGLVTGMLFMGLLLVLRSQSRQLQRLEQKLDVLKRQQLALSAAGFPHHTRLPRLSVQAPQQQIKSMPMSVGGSPPSSVVDLVPP